MNSITMTGRLTADPELKSTPSGISVCAFSIAVARPHAKDVTDFINCVAWRKTAEFITQYFTKGKTIGITGVLTSRKYEDKNGNKRTAFEVVVDNAEFCGDAKNTQSQTADKQPREAEPQNAVEQTSVTYDVLEPDDDDLPF